ncbi:MAG: hypothetical protein J2P49_10555 [Methylocapsa sp.]|nr:hypothetical protein [Methylocapsa sp.]
MIKLSKAACCAAMEFVAGQSLAQTAPRYSTTAFPAITFAPKPHTTMTLSPGVFVVDNQTGKITLCSVTLTETPQLTCLPPQQIPQ